MTIAEVHFTILTDAKPQYILKYPRPQYLDIVFSYSNNI